MERELPNLLLGVTYNLNKSGSKSVYAGLEYLNDRFTPVIKFSSSSYINHLTLTVDEWTYVKQNFDTISAHLEERKTYYTPLPNEITLPHHAVSLKTAYGKNCVTLTPPAPVSVAPEENAAKKLKFSVPPPYTMQCATFNGLQSVTPLIDMHLDSLNECVDKINTLYTQLFDHVKNKLTEEESAGKPFILKDFTSFKTYYHMGQEQIELQ